MIESIKGQGAVGSLFELKYLKVIRDDNGKILKIKPSKKYEIAIVRVKNLSFEKRKKISARAYHWAIEERKYDYMLLIFGMVLHFLSFRKFYPEWLKAQNKFICSELIAKAFYDIAGVEFSKYTAGGYVTPADIASSAKEKESIEIIMTNRKKG